MSTPIPEKDKTPLILLEERVKALEQRRTVVDEELVIGADILRGVIDRVRALEMAHYVPTPGIDDGIFDPGITPCATSDPQEPYVLDTKPR